MNQAKVKDPFGFKQNIEEFSNLIRHLGVKVRHLEPKIPLLQKYYDKAAATISEIGKAILQFQQASEKLTAAEKEKQCAQLFNTIQTVREKITSYQYKFTLLDRYRERNAGELEGAYLENIFQIFTEEMQRFFKEEFQDVKKRIHLVKMNITHAGPYNNLCTRLRGIIQKGTEITVEETDKPIYTQILKAINSKNMNLLRSSLHTLVDRQLNINVQQVTINRPTQGDEHISFLTLACRKFPEAIPLLLHAGAEVFVEQMDEAILLDPNTFADMAQWAFLPLGDSRRLLHKINQFAFQITANVNSLYSTFAVLAPTNFNLLEPLIRGGMKPETPCERGSEIAKRMLYYGSAIATGSPRIPRSNSTLYRSAVVIRNTVLNRFVFYRTIAFESTLKDVLTISYPTLQIPQPIISIIMDHFPPHLEWLLPEDRIELHQRCIEEEASEKAKEEQHAKATEERMANNKKRKVDLLTIIAKDNDMTTSNNKK